MINIPDETPTLHHIGVAVSDLDKAIEWYTSHLGGSSHGREVLGSFNVEVCFIDYGNTLIELLTPTAETGGVYKFLQEHGPGLHHLCWEVKDLEASLRKLQQQGCTLLDTHPRPGAHGFNVAFVHPRSCGGVLVELCQRKTD